MKTKQNEHKPVGSTEATETPEGETHRVERGGCGGHRAAHTPPRPPLPPPPRCIPLLLTLEFLHSSALRCPCSVPSPCQDTNAFPSLCSRVGGGFRAAPWGGALCSTGALRWGQNQIFVLAHWSLKQCLTQVGGRSHRCPPPPHPGVSEPEETPLRLGKSPGTAPTPMPRTIDAQCGTLHLFKSSPRPAPLPLGVGSSGERRSLFCCHRVPSSCHPAAVWGSARSLRCPPPPPALGGRRLLLSLKEQQRIFIYF